jgi:hypothetical protein
MIGDMNNDAALTGFKPLAARLNLSASTTARVVARLQEIDS